MLALAIDAGGTTIKCGLVSDSAEIVAETSFPSGLRGWEEIRADLFAALDGLLAEAKARGEAPIGIGVGVPGHFRENRRVIVWCYNLPALNDLPLADILEARYGVPTLMDLDTNVSALGEWRFGAGERKHRVVGVAMGTGIGIGVIEDGRIVRATGDFCGYAGHICLDIHGPPCRCGGIGCFEAFATAGAITRYAAERSAVIAGSKYAGLSADELSVENVVAGAREGDPACWETWERVIDACAGASVTFAYLYFPDVIAFGGGVSNAGEFLVGPVRARALHRILPELRGDLHIEHARFGDRAGLVGAACLVLPMS